MKVAAGNGPEDCPGLLRQREAELLSVERDRAIHVPHLIANDRRLGIG
jgi:hypothetical protein